MTPRVAAGAAGLRPAEAIAVRAGVARLCLLGILGGAAAIRAGEPATPVIFQSGPGRFEVAAIDPTAAQAVVALAGEAWAMLAAPLGLPNRFSSPVFVRLVPAAEWVDSGSVSIAGGAMSMRVRPAAAEPGPVEARTGPTESYAFRVVVEAGGVVSLRLRWSEPAPWGAVRRAIVQSLLMRLAVSHHGVTGKLSVPFWLEHAGTGWWRTRAEPAELDAARYRSARLAPPALAELLAWRRGAEEPPALGLGAMWLLTFLQSESTKAGELPALLGRLLAGEPPDAALAASFPGRFATAAERELWWQTGWHHVRRINSLPALGAAESRALLAEAMRLVFAGDEGADVVTPLRQALAHAREPLVDAELKRRAAELNRAVAALHPFYRNAGLALVAALGTRSAAAARREAACAAFEQDWRDALELESAATAALDERERK